MSVNISVNKSVTTFWDLFATAATAEAAPIAVHLCRACFDAMYVASTAQQLSRSNATHQKQFEAASGVDAASILQRFNALPSAPARFVLTETHRTVRTRPFDAAQLLLPSATVAAAARCDACTGALQHIDAATFQLAAAVLRSPYRDSNEVSMCITVPPALCLWWDCILGLFVECVFRCGDEERLPLSPRLRNVVFFPASNGSSSSDGGSASPLYSWRGNLREDQIFGGLRMSLVNDLRNFGLLCMVPPQGHPRWTYCAQGAGQGIICQALFHNAALWSPEVAASAEKNPAQLAAALFTGNLGNATGRLAATATTAPIDATLLQHDAAELQWVRLLREVGPLVTSALVEQQRQRLADGGGASPPLLGVAVCSVSVHHEPLYLYGRYRKFSRTMSQSPWFANGGVRIGRELSLQEEISNRLLDVFFPGRDVEQLNAEAALYDARLVVPSRPTNNNRGNNNGNNNGGGGDSAAVDNEDGAAAAAASAASDKYKSKGHHVRKQEVKQARRDAFKEATVAGQHKQQAAAAVATGAATAAAEVPQRRERQDEDVDGDGEQQNNALPVTATTAVAIKKEDDPFSFVSAHVRPVFDNVRGFCLYRFHAGGREDVDVRMLGNGRPFVLEVISPHRQCFAEAELAALARNVSDTSECIEIDSLQVVPRSIMGDLQKDAEAKRKAYRCVCYSQRPIHSKADPVFARIQAMLPITLQQKTPTRVLHRRSSMTREKRIYSIDIELLNPHWMIVDLITQAGTYVKEFCHGDLGRTVPNLATLLESDFCDIIQLDVKMLFSSLNGVGDDGGANEDDDNDDD